VTGVEDVRDLSDERYLRMLSTNVSGVVFGVRRMAQVMPEGAAIIVTASLAGLTTMTTDPIYAGTKHFVVGFVRSVAPQLAERGIRIHAVCPAIVDTPMLGPVRERVRQAGIDVMTAEEVADVVLMAAHDDSTGDAWTCLPGRAPEKHVFHRFFESA
jgi:NAD(P)-dependent dehydrogenase (short-subunit alcohol dehydrogenase family)